MYLFTSAASLSMIFKDLTYRNKSEFIVRLYKIISQNNPSHTPDMLTFTFLLHALRTAGDWESTWQLISSMLRPGIPRDVPFYNLVLKAIADRANVSTSDLQLVEELVMKMRKQEFYPERETYLTWMKVYFRLGNAA